MGVIFSCQNTQKCLARFDNDTVYLDTVCKSGAVIQMEKYMMSTKK